jgi:hypothetical protein
MVTQEKDEFSSLAVLVIYTKGYEITIQTYEDSDTVLYIAEKMGDAYHGDSLVSLLGLIELGETRGEDWRLEEEEAAQMKVIFKKIFE